MEALDSVAHNHELRADSEERIHVHIDSRTMGVGGYDSWSPNVDPKYLIEPTDKPFEVSFRMKSIR